MLSETHRNTPHHMFCGLWIPSRNGLLFLWAAQLYQRVSSMPDLQMLDELAHQDVGSDFFTTKKVDCGGWLWGDGAIWNKHMSHIGQVSWDELGDCGTVGWKKLRRLWMASILFRDRMKILVLWFHWGVLALVTLLKGISLIWRVAHWACGWKMVNVCESKFEMMGDCGFEHLWKLESGAIHANPNKWGSWLSRFCLATGWKSLCCGFTEGCLPWWRCCKESR